jgi:hypothetical protein
MGYRPAHLSPFQPDEHTTSRAGVRKPKVGDERHEAADAMVIAGRTDGVITDLHSGDSKQASRLGIGDRGWNCLLACQPASFADSVPEKQSMIEVGPNGFHVG